MEIFIIILQVVLAFVLLDVWLIRFSKTTKYRGKGAHNMKEEFHAYGLPSWFMFAVGFLKIAIAVLLVVGIWFSFLVQPASIALSVLMLGAVSMHIKVKDPIVRTLPALAMLTMALLVALL